MRNYRLTYKKLDRHGMYETIFTTIIQSKSMRGAIQRSKNLEPFNWGCREIISLESEFNLKLDKIEFNY